VQVNVKKSTKSFALNQFQLMKYSSFMRLCWKKTYLYQ